MRIAFNPSTVAALTTPPNNKDITFDLRGRNIFARGVKFYGTDTNTWRDIKINNVSIGSHTLDLRNGSNTTLTNTNGVVTINSTWRPVVDNLTSDSTTSSLSAKQGKVLKALIDGKSNSGHTHDDRYVKKSGDTMSGVLTIDTTTFGALTIKRNDDVNGASIQFRGKSNIYGYIGFNAANRNKQLLRWNGAGSQVYTILDTSSTYTSGGKGVINGTTITQVDNADKLDGYHANTSQSPFGRVPTIGGDGVMEIGKYIDFHCDNEGKYDYSTRLQATGNHQNALSLPSGTGTLALTSQIPNKNSWNYDDRYLKLIGGTMAGTINRRSGGSTISGRDHAIIRQTYAPGGSSWNPIACVDTETGTWTLGHLSQGSSNTDFSFCFSTNADYNAGNNNGNYVHLRNKVGIIALTSEIPSKGSWNYDDRYYTKAESNAKYITDITTSVNKLTFTRNGSNIARTITVNNVQSLGKRNPLTERNAISGIYTYGTYYATDNLAPTNYFETLGFGEGTSGTIEIGGSWISGGKLYWRALRNCCEDWFSWKTILDSSNYSGILDSRYYTESEANSLLSKKLDRVNLSVGTWNPRGYSLAADYYYNGGDLSISENGGKMYVSVDGCFWQNEGKYRVLDTSDINSIQGSLILNQYLSSTDTSWYPLVWGGDTHKNTGNSTGSLYKSYDILTWQTSSQTLYATRLRTTDITFPNSGTSMRGIQGTVGDDDFWRIKGGATASNSGYLEIATADDGNEPIYVRQYTGTFSTIKRTLTLLDTNGFAHFPSYINIGGNENNNSSPDRVWGSNGSDSYLRSYRTSALRVAYAVNANSATTASSASKLTTARNIALGTDLRGSANFDGSGNITIYANINACTVSVSSTNGLPFKRIAHFETGGSWNDNALLLYISQGYINGSNGICRVEFRTDNISSSSTSVTASAAVRWLVRNGYGLDSLYAGYYVTAGKAYIDIYLKTTSGYQGTVIRVLQDSRGGINSNVQLINSYYHSDTNHKEAYNSIEAASTALYNRAYTRIVSGSDVGTVSYSNSTGSVHWNNVTNKPSSFNPSSHRHDWSQIDNKPATATRWPSWAEVTGKPSSLKNPYAIKFKDINGNVATYDGSAAKDLTAGTYIAKLPYGFASFTSGATWGNTTGTSFASWNDSTGGSIDFRRDNPSKGKMSIKVDGRVYVNEGANPVLSAEYSNSFWGMRTPDGGNDWIRTPNNGLIPYVPGEAGVGHSSLGTSTWYFSTAYIDKVYGSLKGNADSATSTTKVIVNQHTTNDANYPLVWSNQSNTNNATENQLFKSWADLYYNPKNKRLCVAGSAIIGASAIPSYTLDIRGSVIASSWLRTRGASGWYSESYGGGIYMSDTTWIRTFGDKPFYCNKQIYSSDSIRMGDIYLQYKNEINNGANGTLHLNYRGTGYVTLCNGGGAVIIGTTPTDIGNNKLYVNGSEFINGASNVKDHVFANGFRHRSHNSNDSVLLAGGGYSVGCIIKYWAIYSIYLRPTAVNFSKMSGNHSFISTMSWEKTGSAILEIKYPSGFSESSTMIFGNGDHQGYYYDAPVYVTISKNYGNNDKLRITLANDTSLDEGEAYLYFLCMG